MRRASILLILFSVSLAYSGLAQQRSLIFEDTEFIVIPEDRVNTLSSEISPVYVNGSVYFSSIPEYYFNQSSRIKNNTAFYTVMNTAVDENGKIISSPRLVPGFGEEYHEGPVDYCERTGELFVTVSNLSSASESGKSKKRLQLVIKKFSQGKWQTISELPFNNRNFNFAHPAISITGDTLIFSSDMDSINYGKADLYISVRKDQSWSTPVNMGNYINTPGNEYFPVILPGGLLSFASDGRTINRGGLDIYYTRFPNPGRVESPDGDINSPFDDFGLVIHEKEEIGYFTSNRNALGSDDIFRVEIRKLNNVLAGVVLGIQDKKPVANSKISLLKCNGALINATVTDSSGYFTIKKQQNDCIHLEAVKEGYQTFTSDATGKNYLEIELVPDSIAGR